MQSSDVQKSMRRFVVLFPICLLVGFGLLQVPWVSARVEAFTRGIVVVSAAAIHLFGGKVFMFGRVLQSPTGFAIEVQNGCNAVSVTILLWAAMLTYPSPWMHKLTGLAAGSAAIHGLNLVRVISLFYLGQFNKDWFEFAHMYLWESLIVLDTLVVFWIWATLSRKSMARENVPAQ